MAVKRAHITLVVVVSLFATANAATTHHRRTHSRRVHHLSHRVHRVVWNPLFPGSRDMLIRQNEWLDEFELPRIATEQELISREEAEELVPVESSRSLALASSLPENRRYCKPWTREFLEDLGEAYYQRFHQPLTTTSLVRTIDQQKKLRRSNRNAGPEGGDTASTHLTGVTVDILRRGITRTQHRWLEQYFLPLKEAGLIDPIEERRQPVFHVVVFKSYSDSKHAQEPAPIPEPQPVADTKESPGAKE